MAKLVYFSREPHSRDPGGRLNFITFETDRIDDCIEFMKQHKIKQQKLNGSRPGELCVMATGGGAYKFYDKVREALGVDVSREEEMECLIIGRHNALAAIDRTLIRNRTGLFHHRNTPRGIHIQRNRPYTFRRTASGHISILACQHRIWC